MANEKFENKTEAEHEEWAKTHILIDEKPEDAYERIFGEAIQKYDAKQKRSDRRIGNGKKYYEKIKNSKNKVPVYEFIITLGNKDNLPDNTEEVRNIYIEALENFRQRNPNLEVIGAYYHDDEIRDDGKGGKIQGAPHLHVDYIPVSRNRWQNFIDKQNKQEGLIDKLTGKKIEKKTRVNGLDVENSLTEALEAQGYISKELDVSVIEKKFGIHISGKHYKDPERQAQYAEELSEREENVFNLETKQKAVEAKEKDILIREKKIQIDAEANKKKDEYLRQQHQELENSRMATQDYLRKHELTGDYFTIDVSIPPLLEPKDQALTKESRDNFAIRNLNNFANHIKKNINITKKKFTALLACVVSLLNENRELRTELKKANDQCKKEQKSTQTWKNKSAEELEDLANEYRKTGTNNWDEYIKLQIKKQRSKGMSMGD